MKHKMNILIPVFILLVLVYAVRAFAGTRIQAETLRRGSMEDMVSAKGVVIKYETVTAAEGGTVEALVQEGARVGAGQEIAAVYTGSVDPQLRTRLDQVNNKIVQVEKNQSGLFSFSGDVTRLEQTITEKTAELIAYSRAKNLTAASETQLVLEALCAKKAQIAGNASTGVLEELRAQKTQLENQIGTAQRRLYAASSGVFSASVDGLEEVVTPYSMTELTPSALDGLLERDKGQDSTGDRSACKIIQNFRYFIAVNLPTDRLTGVQIDDSVNLRFYDLSGDLQPASVMYISPEEDGRKTVILAMTRYVDSLLKRRFVNLDFVKHRYEGYRVSVRALRTKNDVTGVYVRRDDVPKFIPITVLYNTQDVAIIQSVNEETPLRLYDEVIVNAGQIEEGKLLR